MSLEVNVVLEKRPLKMLNREHRGKDERKRFFEWVLFKKKIKNFKTFGMARRDV